MHIVTLHSLNSPDRSRHKTYTTSKYLVLCLSSSKWIKLFDISDCKMPAHRSKCWIGFERRSRQDVVRTLWWLFTTGQDDDRNTCTSKSIIIISDIKTYLLLLYLQPSKFSKSGILSEGPLAKKHAGDKKISAEKKKILKDKKRTLKRLWNL